MWVLVASLSTVLLVQLDRSRTLAREVAEMRATPPISFSRAEEVVIATPSSYPVPRIVVKPTFPAKLRTASRRQREALYRSR